MEVEPSIANGNDSTKNGFCKFSRFAGVNKKRTSRPAMVPSSLANRLSASSLARRTMPSILKTITASLVRRSN